MVDSIGQRDFEPKGGVLKLTNKARKTRRGRERREKTRWKAGRRARLLG